MVEGESDLCGVEDTPFVGERALPTRVVIEVAATEVLKDEEKVASVLRGTWRGAPPVRRVSRVRRQEGQSREANGKRRKEAIIPT